MSVYIHDSGSEAQESDGNDEEEILTNDINEESIECIVKKALQKHVTRTNRTLIIENNNG